MPLKLKDLVSKFVVRTDKKAAKEVEKEVTSVTDRISERASQAFKRIGAAIAAAFALKVIYNFGKEAIKAAAEAEAAWASLATSVEGAGVKFDEVEGKLTAMSKAFADATVHGDDDFAVTLQRLIALTGDYSRSLEHVGLVADVAAEFFGGELAPAADLVGKALAGNVRGMKALGIMTTDADAALRELADRTMGRAEARTKTFSGQVGELTDAWGEFKEAIGAALIEAGGGISIIQTLTAGLQQFTAFVEQNSDSLIWFGQGAIQVAVFGMRVLIKSLVIAANAYSVAASAAGWFIGLISNKTGNAVDAHAERIKKLADALNKAADAQLVFSQTPKRTRSAGATPVRPTASPTTEEGTGILPGGGIGLAIEEIEEGADRAEDAAERVKTSWEIALDTMAEGFDRAGDAANGFAAGSAAALLSGLAAYAKAEAAKETALGISKSAAGLWPPNPAALAAGAGHFAGALAWGAVAALVGASASRTAGSGGRSGGGAVGSSRSTGDSTVNNLDRQTVIYVHLDPFNPRNPVHKQTGARLVKAGAEIDSSINIRPERR